jgi:hypothetical protein
MKLLVAVAGMLLLLAVGGVTDAGAQAKCLVPPVTEDGKCLQRAGARCDPAKGWVGGNEAARTACRNSEAQRKNCVRCTVLAKRCGDRWETCLEGGRRDPWVKGTSACGSWYGGCFE